MVMRVRGHETHESDEGTRVLFFVEFNCLGKRKKREKKSGGMYKEAFSLTALLNDSMIMSKTRRWPGTSATGASSSEKTQCGIGITLRERGAMVTTITCELQLNPS